MNILRIRVHGKHKANPTPSTEFLWLNANLLSVLTGTIQVWAAHKLILYTRVKHSSTKQKINRNAIWKSDITNKSCEILTQSDSRLCPDLGTNWYSEPHLTNPTNPNPTLPPLGATISKKWPINNAGTVSSCKEQYWQRLWMWAENPFS